MSFFEKFFLDRGDDFTPNTQGEVPVCCPFPHNKGFEKHPSAHINVEKGLFHCKTCRAEGRFQDGGLSEVNFVAHLHDISYQDAIRTIEQLYKDRSFDSLGWHKAEELLRGNHYWDILTDRRGLTEETITTYRLAYNGSGVTYPITIYNEILDIRTYSPDEHPKMSSEKGASPLLYPFDHWRKDDRPTLLCAGENDTLLARQIGFNALTVTAGEGVFPKVFLPMFKGKDVFICYDCDEAGRTGGRMVACQLRDAGANVRMVDLGLPGTKDDKDFTDFILKHNRSYADVDELIRNARPYSSEEFLEDKNRVYPLVDLWTIHHGEYEGRRFSARVVMAGRYDQPMGIPSALEFECVKYNADNEACMLCPMKKKGDKRLWMLEDKNLSDLLQLVEVTPNQQAKKIQELSRIPEDCPGHITHRKAYKGVVKAIFTPDVATEDETSGFKAVEQYAYILEKPIDNRLDLEDGQRYRIYFRRFAHPLQDQRVVLIVDKAEPSDNAMNMFRMTEDIKEQLKVFQGNPFEMMEDRAKRHHALTVVFRPNPLVANAVDISYHSVLKFKFNGRELKGTPEIGIIGESRTGKTETAELFQRYIGVGNKVDLKVSSTAGLLGGADRLPNGGFRIKWGTIPRNHRGLVILDEFSGASREMISSLTAVRSSGVANVEKIASGKVPAQTRLLWIANPRVGPGGQSKPLMQYPNGVRIVLDLVGSDEDVARFDALMIIPQGEQSSPLDKPEVEAHSAEAYRNLVYWAWTRNSDQVIFEEGVEEYVVQVAKELNEKYNTDVKLFGGEAWKKVARIAVACASACFNCDDSGERILVGKSHVDWASNFLVRCYDNPIFRLVDYVKDRRAHTETNAQVNAEVAHICRNAPIIVRTLMDAADPIPSGTLQSLGAMERSDFSKILNKMAGIRLINISDKGITATLRFRKAVAAYREDYKKTKMVPLIEEGSANV